MTTNIKTTFQTKWKPILTNPKILLALWLIVGLCSALFKIRTGDHNNFLIFRGVFWHTLNQTSLYDFYPNEYFDINHYGPLFSIVVAPFALLPETLGFILWNLSLTMLLYWAVNQLNLTRYQFIFIIWYCAHELLTALFMQQFNVATAALILLTYAFIRDEKDIWGTLMIVIGMYVKLYGIVGLALFFLSRHKIRFILWGLLWCVIMFCLPMLISSPEYIISQYAEWYTNLASKNMGNEISLMQNISLLGMIRKIGYAATFGMTQYWATLRYETPVIECFWSTYSDLWVIIPGLILLCICLFRTSQWKNNSYWLTILASLLMFVCLFSTGTESSSYIIAFVGVVLWYTAATWQRNRWDIALMVFAFLITSMSPSDLFPAYIRREWIQPFALKSLPVTIIWFKLCYEMITKDYATQDPHKSSN